jgi:photosystem II stability/assembly factor-like uncharacterized protein
MHQSWRSSLLGLAIAALMGGLAPPPHALAQQADTGYYAGMRWRSIGPYRSGNVYSVSGVPGDPTVYYIGTPEAGVWKTTDGGTVWNPIFDDLHVPSIGAVAVAPSDPNIVYVGTGDPTGWSFTPGNGVYKSTDAGRKWVKMGLEGTRYITSIMVDSRNPNIVLVGALGARERDTDTNSARGVYRSTDGGRTWKHVLYKDVYTGAAGMTSDFADPKVIYVALARTVFRLPGAWDSLPPPGNGIYKSTNEGATWHQVAGRGLPSEAESFLIAVASGTRGQRVYAEAQGRRRDAIGLYRSDDGGESWTLATKQILSAGGGPIYVDPKDPDALYLMGTAMYRSVDGGRHVVAYKGSPGGDDPRDLWIDPTNPRRMLMGVDQGPTITVDGGETWTPWYNLPNGQFYHVSTDDHFPYFVCAAQQDSGTACVLSRSDFGAIRDNDWYPIGGFEDGYIVTDPTNWRWIYTQGWYHALRRYDRETGQVAVVYSPAPEDRFSNAPPMAFSPQDPHLLYMGAQYVLAASDEARSWRRISPDLTVRAGVADSGQSGLIARLIRPAILTLSPSTVHAGQIWVGTSNGMIQLTRDGGESWRDVTPAEMPRGPVVSVNIIDPSRDSAGVAYAAVEPFRDPHPYIFRTPDFGGHWQKIVTGLPNDAAVRVVREDPVDPSVLYAGTLTGVWVSFDRGDRWQSLQLNLPTTVITDMVVHGNDLAISTYGRSLWILDDVTPLRQMRAVAAATSKAYLFGPAQAYRVRWDNIQDTPLPPEVPAGDNPPEGAIIDYYLKSPAVGPVTLSVYDGAGHLVRQYSSIAPATDSVRPNIAEYWLETPVVLGTGAGMHRVAWDLRYPAPSVVNYSYFGDLLDYREYTLNVHAIKGLTPRVQPTGPLVVPGTYRIELKVDGETHTREVTIVNDPRVLVTQAGLEAQLQLEQQMMAGLSVSYSEFASIQRLRAAVVAAQARADTLPSQAQTVTALKTLDAHAAALADSGFGPANRDLTRHLEDMEFGDLDPTASTVAATEADCRAIDGALAKLRQLEATEVAAVNGILAGGALPVESPSAAPACGATPGAGTRP